MISLSLGVLFILITITCLFYAATGLDPQTTGKVVAAAGASALVAFIFTVVGRWK